LSGKKKFLEKLKLNEFSINKTDRYDIAEILLKVALNTITLIPPINIEVLELS
jgi:hypothetical protein